jgi:hypothetical protein
MPDFGLASIGGFEMVGMEHARFLAERVQAIERIMLRRWLRNTAVKDTEGYLPAHLFMVQTKDELIELVNQKGGNVASIILEARKVAIDKITKGE